MDTDDLFSFLDPNAANDDNDDEDAQSVADVEIADAPQLNSPSSLKRKVGSPTPATTNGAGPSTSTATTTTIHDDSEPSTKKQRLAAPSTTPVGPAVTDEFSTEASRSVAASAGLTGAAVEPTSRLELRHQVRHQVAVPPGYAYVPISQHVPPAKPAREYPFTLDPFQEVSIHAIQRNESVLVSAHTSAGKTVVAEYAIAQCLANKQRVIYTSPIKALSNQKYRDLLSTFGDVGLMTGDTTISPSSTCLVMTTEILRSMLYRGSSLLHETAWVIFDEIHYMRDSERGVVWEESIILLPPSVKFAFLSATIPNAMQFAEWVCKWKREPVHVVYTDFRPTPLQHYLFPAGGEGIYLVVNEKSEFREDNFAKAMGTLADSKGEDPANPNSGKGRKGKTKKGGQKGPSDISKILKMLLLKAYDPVIVFAFSKRECEALALSTSKLTFTSEKEAESIKEIFTNAITNLAVADQALPQITNILPLLQRGIGVHHGGLLPILKEVIEILFQEGLIKVLFATETFSIGLNMPAKTVVFTSPRKFDGTKFRPLSSGEFIQMSGRAGRRGLDDRGVVIVMIDEKMEPAVMKEMIKGEADRLNSAFRVGWNMVLNLLRLDGVSPEYMLERCFFQFQASDSLPQLEVALNEATTKLNAIKVEDEELVKEYHAYRTQLDELGNDFHEVVTHPTYALPFLQPGRLVRVKWRTVDWGWGVVLEYRKRVPAAPRKGPAPKPENLPPHEQYVIDVLLNVLPSSTLTGPTTALDPLAPSTSSSPTTPTPTNPLAHLGIHPCPPGTKGGQPQIIPVLLSTIDGISHIRVFLPKDLRSAQARDTAWKSVQEVHRRFPDGVALLDPVQNMGIKDEKFRGLIKKIETMEDKMFSHALHKDPRLPSLFTQYSHKLAHQKDIRELKKRIQATHDVLQLEELKSKKRVLRRLGFTSTEDIVDVKGRVACEISTGDELLLTEMMFNGVFNGLEPELCAAVLCCFVFDEKSEQQTRLKEELAAPLRSLQEMARRIARVVKESKLPIEEDEYVQSFKVELMECVIQWCRGASFSDICKLTDVFEGSVIRVFRRLQELLRQMTQAAKVIGNRELELKFEKASELLERPNSVIFCSSLYL